MVLTAEQRMQLVPLIVDHLGESRSGVAAIELFGPAAVREVPAGLNDFRHATWLLEHVLNAETPAGFVAVVTAVDPAGQLPEVHLVVERLRIGQLPWGGAGVDELWMPARWPFADREGLRTALCDTARGLGAAAMTIEGPAGHGKRTMCSYLEHAARKHGVYTPVVEHLQRLDDPGVLDALVTQLRLTLGVRSEVVSPHVEPQRRAVALARELARDAAFSPTPVWFVANVLEPVLDDGVLVFVDELLRLVQDDPVLARGVRVAVLADFATVSLRNLPGVEHRHALPEIAEGEVARWLAAAAPGKAQALYDLAACRVIDQVAARAPTPRLRLRHVALQCLEAHRVLAGAP